MAIPEKPGQSSACLGRLTVCAVAGIALVVVILAGKNDAVIDLSRSQVDYSGHSLLFNAERIAKGLEAKNARRADDVIVSYTSEDKILAGFQKAVKERDAKFRSELAHAAKESKVEERATQQYDNNWDPDDPHFKSSLLPVSAQVVPKASPLEAEKDEKTLKVQSHIDHEVEEITGDESSSSKAEILHKEHKQVHRPSLVSSPEQKQAIQKQAESSQANLAQYMQSKSFYSARKAALNRAKVAQEKMSSQKSVPRVEVEAPKPEIVQKKVQKSLSQIVSEAKAEHKMTPVDSQAGQDASHRSPMLSHSEPEHGAVSTVSQKENILPLNLQNYMKVAPSDLKAYMKSEAYRRIREKAERQSEKYFDEHDKKFEKQSPVAKPTVMDATAHPTKATLKGENEKPLKARPSNVNESRMAAEELRKYMASPMFKSHEHAAEDVKSVEKPSHLSEKPQEISPKPAQRFETMAKASKEPSLKADPMESERAELEKYINGPAFKKHEAEAAKVLKLAELHRFMASKEFRKKEFDARSRSMISAK